MSVAYNFWSGPTLSHTNPGGGSAFGVVRSVRTLYEALSRASFRDFAYGEIYLK